MTFQNFNDAVLQWAASNNITNPETQLLKYFEEKGEFARALLNKDEKAIQDERYRAWRSCVSACA